jgi:hypothetical protein
VSVTDITSRLHPQPQVLTFSPTARAVGVAFGMIQRHELPECHVHVFSGGQNIVLDYTRSQHPAGDVRVACQALGLVVEELAAECPDGTAAIELRGTCYQDGILRTVRAVVPLEAKLPAL